MASNLTPYKHGRTPTQRRPWWQRSYRWNVWAVLGLGVLWTALLLLAHLTVSVLEGLS
jgi:hypothetical protein